MKYKFVKYHYTLENYCNCETITSEWCFMPQTEEVAKKYCDGK